MLALVSEDCSTRVAQLAFVETRVSEILNVHQMWHQEMVWIMCFRIEESSLAPRTYPLQKDGQMDRKKDAERTRQWMEKHARKM